jgi:trans-aconitate methyltransferase
MDLKESDALGDLAEQHWYYRSKAAAMGRYIQHIKPIRVLDIGAGSGFFTKYLLRETTVSMGVCVDTGYRSEWDEEINRKTIQFRRSCGKLAVDLVLLMDVLEHVDDDCALLLEYASKVPTGTPFLITVPAFQWLWSGHDVFLEHRRRYEIAELEKTIRNARLNIERSSYYFGFILPIVAALRLSESLTPGSHNEPASQLRRHSWLTNTILTTICRSELPICRINRLGGLSVFCLARKT